jgi:hypothetical protein
MKKLMSWLVLASALTACTTDDTADFVGAWRYAPGSTVAVDCGGGAMDVPFDTIVETFAESGGRLEKSDSQGCTGLVFAVDGRVAKLAGAGESCAIPANGDNPGATFAPSAYSFTLSDDGKSLTEALTAAYTPDGAPAACAVTAHNMLTRAQATRARPDSEPEPSESEAPGRK